MTVLVAFLALALESLIGYPDAVFRAVGHPVTWIGTMLDWLDRQLNAPALPDAKRRQLGIAAIAVVTLVPALAAFALQQLLLPYTLGIVVLALAGSTLFAQRSLAAHVRAVADALEEGGLSAGRSAVSEIVGRDPEQLDRAAVCRAAIESLAENFSDGIAAPAFWFALGGLPGAVVYKAVNTADSMIGHRTPRHEAFGWAAARLDDLVNLPASRLSALLLVAAAAAAPGADARAAWRAVRRDAALHCSPNAGWPEAAMAGALGLALAGPRSYGGVAVDGVHMGRGGRTEAAPADIRRALVLFWIADFILMGLLAALAGVVIAIA
jgi:adenosylcobinamide-phosphate synthase